MKTPKDIALDAPLTERFNDYVEKELELMINAGKQGSFEWIIAQETDVTRKLDNAYNEVLLAGDQAAYSARRRHQRPS